MNLLKIIYWNFVSSYRLRKHALSNAQGNKAEASRYWSLHEMAELKLRRAQGSIERFKVSIEVDIPEAEANPRLYLESKLRGAFIADFEKLPQDDKETTVKGFNTPKPQENKDDSKPKGKGIGFSA
jgi:hypothetical protein